MSLILTKRINCLLNLKRQFFEKMNIAFVTKEDFKSINELEERDLDLNMLISDLPVFMQNIVNFSALSNPGSLKFMRKFGIYYIDEHYSFIKEFVDNCVFLIAGGDYIGAFQNKDDAIKRANELGFERKDVFVLRMYPRRVNEFRETV